jgi:undecaprenol kinase
MSTISHRHSDHRQDQLSSANRRRPPGRRRLVEAERGLTQGFRGDSTLMVYLFAACLTVAAGLVLGLPALQWAVLVLAFALVLAAELFNKVLRTLCRQATGDAKALRHAASLGTAAVLVTILAAVVVVGLFLGGRLSEILPRT